MARCHGDAAVRGAEAKDMETHLPAETSLYNACYIYMYLHIYGKLIIKFRIFF